MLELLLVLGSLVGFCLIALITVVVTPQIMIELGLGVLAVGLLTRDSYRPVVSRRTLFLSAACELPRICNSALST